MRGPMRSKGRLLDVVAVRRARRARRAVLVPAHRHARGRRPVAVPGRVPAHRRRLAGRHRRRHPPPHGRRPAARHARPAVDRHPLLRAVPVPLADLPDHAPASPASRCRSPSSSAALAISAVVTEISFRLIETPIRKGHVGRWWRRLQAPATRAAAGDRRRRRRVGRPVGVRRRHAGDRRAEAERDRRVAGRGVRTRSPTSTISAHRRRPPSPDAGGDAPRRRVGGVGRRATRAVVVPVLDGADDDRRADDDAAARRRRSSPSATR